MRKLLVVESGIDPAKFDAYVRDYESPVVRYPRVSSPGRVIREADTGSYQFVPVSVAEYFKILGVDHLFDPASPACLAAMQHASTNVLGFVGYQFGESALIRNGYYRPEVVRYREHRGRERSYDSYYIGSIEDARWRDGRTQQLYRLPRSRTDVLATDVNRWRGTFTGKNGVASLNDLKVPQLAELVMRDNLDANHAVLRTLLVKNGYDVRAAYCTWSGLLAAAHLCGPHAAAAYVLSGAIAKDAFQTDIRTYYSTFGGFETPYCAPNAHTRLAKSRLS